MNYKYRIEEKSNEAVITGVIDCYETLILPMEIEHEGKNYRVTELRPDLSPNNGLCCKKLIIPSFIKKIAILNNNSIEHVEILEGVESFGTLIGGFQRCRKLKSITLPNTMKRLSVSAFRGCCRLKEIYLPDSIEQISPSVFKDCITLENVRLPQNITAIPERLFEGCVSLKEIALPTSVLEVGEEAFYGCTNLTQIKYNTQCKFHDNTFAGCDALMPSMPQLFGKSSYVENGFLYTDSSKTDLVGFIKTSNNERHIVLPKTINRMKAVFIGCDDLLTIDMSNTQITEIPDNAFLDCANLYEVKLPLKLKTIGYNSFYGCKSLKKLHLPSNVIFEKQSFPSELEFISIDEGDLTRLSHQGTIYSKDMSRIDYIPTSIKELFIPRNVDNPINIIWTLFNLEKVTLESGRHDGFRDIDNAIYNSEGDYLLFVPDGVKRIYIPDTVQRINEKAFVFCNRLEEVSILDGFNIKGLFDNSIISHVKITVRKNHKPQNYRSHQIGAYTHCRMRPCPYCGNDDVNIFTDGTATCNACHGEYCYFRM